MIASRISDRIHMIDTIGLGEPNTVAAYIVTGSKTAIVDCGYASSYATVLRGLVELNILPSEVDYIIPTHVHQDHSGAAGHLSRDMPRAIVIAHERAVPHLIDPSRLIQSVSSVFGEGALRLYGTPIGIPQDRITAVGQELHVDLGGPSLTVVHTPGHAPHQISIFVEEERSLLTADAVGICHPAIPAFFPQTPPPSFDPTKLVHSVELLEQMRPEVLLLPHFGTRTDVESVFEQTKRKTMGWVEIVSRMQKEGSSTDRVEEALAGEVARDAHIASDALPLYASRAIKTSVAGILLYLAKSSQSR